MKNRNWKYFAAVGAAVMLLSGCGGEGQKTFEQAGKDLEQGNYQYALEGYETSIANEVKTVQSYRGAGIANLRLGNYDAAVEDFTAALGGERVSEACRETFSAIARPPICRRASMKTPWRIASPLQNWEK